MTSNKMASFSGSVATKVKIVSPTVVFSDTSIVVFPSGDGDMNTGPSSVNKSIL